VAATAALKHPGIGELGVGSGAGDEGAEAAPVEAAPSNASKRSRQTVSQMTRQAKVQAFYNSNAVQVLVAVIISANFATNMVEKQVDPTAEHHSAIFEAIGIIYNVAFTIELLINMYAHWWRPFFKSSWNIFDLVVVTIGVVNMADLPLPKPLRLLRMMRAFRVFRLFKRVKSLNKIIVAIVHAVPGVMNAFLILTIVMCIYSILAVEFYKEVGVGCQDDGYARPGFDTKREDCMGREYFGNFAKSIYTFFQVLTGESWAENVARPVIWFYQDQFRSLASACFFVSFVLVTGFVLTNVVVAVLLDKMTANQEEEEEEAEAAPPADRQITTESQRQKLTDDEKLVAKQMSKLKDALGELGSGKVEIERDFDRVKADMVEMNQQMARLGKALERKYRLAAL